MCHGPTDVWSIVLHRQNLKDQRTSSVVQYDIDQGTVNDHPAAVVVYVTEIAESIEEEADTGSGCADHLRQSFLTDLGDDRNRLGFLTEVSHQHEQPRKAFFTGIEQMIDEISFHADVACKQVREELLSELRFTMKQALHHGFFDANDAARFNCVRRGDANLLTCQASFTKEAGYRKMCNNSFLATHRYDGELYLATLDVKYSIGLVAL